MGRRTWLELEPLLSAALDAPTAERSRFLEKIDVGQGDRRQQLERWIAADRAAGAFLEQPAVHRLGDERAVGRRIGGYRLLELLGKGGMGAVYLAQRDDEEFCRQVAIKLVRAGLGGDEYRHRLRAERQILAALEHPNIARLYDGGTTDDGQPYLVMEYVDGLAIDEHCERCELGTEARLRLFLEVLSAVEHAHRHGLVHRDLKPANILVTEQGVPKLLDFGIAKILDPGPTASDLEALRTDLRPMTPAYASPEQVRGETVTPASDVYALGVLLYRLLTGRLPFEDGEQVVRAVLEKEPVSPSARVARLGGTTRRLRGDLDHIVFTALAEQPSRRYASAQELAEDVRCFLENRPVRARSGSILYRLVKGVLRQRWVAAACAGLLLASGFGVHQERRLEHERNSASRVTRLLASNATHQIARGNFADAERSLLRALDIYDATYAANHPPTAFILDELCRLYHRRGDFEAGRFFGERAVRLRRRALGEGHPLTARSLGSLALVSLSAGEAEAGQRVFEEAVAVIAGLPDKEVDVEAVLNLAAFGLSSGQPQIVEPLLDRTLPLAYRSRVHAPESFWAHMEWAGLLLQKGIARDLRGDGGGARPFFERSVAEVEALERRSPSILLRQIEGWGLFYLDQPSEALRIVSSLRDQGWNDPSLAILEQRSLAEL